MKKDTYNTLLDGVNHELIEDNESCKYSSYITKELLNKGVEFNNIDKNKVPWLVGVEPFELNEDLLKQLQEIGEATFLYIDAIQKLYLNKHPVIEDRLFNKYAEKNFNHLQEKRNIDTFRLDIIIENGILRVTEIEEVYGNAGKVCAMNDVYNNNLSEKLLKSFSGREIKYIYVDDNALGYINENKILAKYLMDYNGTDVIVKNYSQINTKDKGNAWRFIYTKDIGKYNKEIINTTILHKDRFFNSLFHGFGSKKILPLIFDESVVKDIKNEIGIKNYNILTKHYPFSKEITKNSNLEELLDKRKKLVLKVLECDDEQKFEWGARGVYFGNTSKKKWESYLINSRDGFIPISSKKIKAKTMLSELVDSDKFDIKFYHPYVNKIGLMNKARIRIGAIFFRNDNIVEFTGGHATFVNTSRKIHLGEHAICVPLKYNQM